MPLRSLRGPEVPAVRPVENTCRAVSHTQELKNKSQTKTLTSVFPRMRLVLRACLLPFTSINQFLSVFHILHSLLMLEPSACPSLFRVLFCLLLCHVGSSLCFLKKLKIYLQFICIYLYPESECNPLEAL